MTTNCVKIIWWEAWGLLFFLLFSLSSLVDSYFQFLLLQNINSNMSPYFYLTLKPWLADKLLCQIAGRVGERESSMGRSTYSLVLLFIFSCPAIIYLSCSFDQSRGCAEINKFRCPMAHLLPFLYFFQVRARCRSEWALFQNRLTDADKAYLAQIEKN